VDCELLDLSGDFKSKGVESIAHLISYIFISAAAHSKDI